MGTVRETIPMRKENAVNPKCKVVWLGEAKPDDPRYKEGWSIAVQPSDREVEQALAELRAEGKLPPAKPKPKKPQGKK